MIVGGKIENCPRGVSDIPGEVLMLAKREKGEAIGEHPHWPVEFLIFARVYNPHIENSLFKIKAVFSWKWPCTFNSILPFTKGCLTAKGRVWELVACVVHEVNAIELRF